MSVATKKKLLEFSSEIIKPKKSGDDFVAFVILPKEISDELPRRGRTSVDLIINNYQFQITLEPDGNLSHWAKLTDLTLASAKVQIGDRCNFKINPVTEEPDPAVPSDLQEAISASPKSFQTWQETTVIARIDWIHWVESAKQSKTRVKRISDACNMLAEGKRRVCCFDNSGFYSKALKAPPRAD